VVAATGSGGTVAGLLAGCRLLDLPYRVLGICVCDNEATFQVRIADILVQMARRNGLELFMTPNQVEIWDGYVGRGYALSRDDELRRIRDVARLEGLITDPVYSGKALHGLLRELEKGRELPQPVVFLHTGGIYGLFPKQQQLAPLL
jgi:D-cysteine desulfhydrase